MQFYYAIGDDKRGPVSIDQLAAAGVTADTLVWRSGMDDWTEARNLPDVLAALNASPASSPDAYPPPAGPPAHGTPSPHYGSPPPQYGNPLAYQSPGYQPPVGYQPANAAPPAGQGLCTASMVLGIAALVTMCIYGLGIVAAIAGIICGHMGQSAFRKQTGRTNGMATAGLVCSYIALVLTVLFIALILVAVVGSSR